MKKQRAQKSTLESICEKLTDDELAFLENFTSDPSKGAATQLDMLMRSVESEATRRAPERQSRTSSSMQLACSGFEAIASQHLLVEKSRALKKALTLDTLTPWLAVCFKDRDNRLFGDELLERFNELDADWFSLVTDIIKTVRSAQARRKLGTGSKALFALHVSHAARLVVAACKANEELPNKQALAEAVSAAVAADGGDPYSDSKDWRDVWLASGCSDLPQAQTGRGGSWIKKRPRS
jgi:hypothetical protein